MHFCKNILKHLALMQEMGKAHMPDSLLKDQKQEPEQFTQATRFLPF